MRSKISPKLLAKGLFYSPDLIIPIYRGLIRKHLTVNKDYKKAYYYLNQYSSIRDTILSEEKNKSMAEMQTRFDTDSKEKEITLLKKK